MSETITILGRVNGEVCRLWVGEMDVDTETLTLTCPSVPPDARLCSALRDLRRSVRWVRTPALPGHPGRWRVKQYSIGGWPGRETLTVVLFDTATFPLAA